MVTQLKCIEGWSEIVHWGGARLRDFMHAYPPARGENGRLPRYVGFETPDRQYYVGLYMEDALHPQTLLCYEMNGQPLSREHGAPLRLVTPLKYGIKHLKQIGSISYTDRRPRDYWAENDYDYYAGH
jgi:DMSO/TMAO reductase YedYZ molybdopterin-dependent catalytic subunit